MEKKAYESPAVKTIVLNTDDVLLASPVAKDLGNFDWGVKDDFE